MYQELKNKIIENLPEEKIEKKIHTPNCLRGTDKYNHLYCEISKEDEGYNECLSDIDPDKLIKVVLEYVKEIIEKVPTEFPQYESDDMDVGAKKFKKILLDNLTKDETNNK